MLDRASVAQQCLEKLKLCAFQVKGDADADRSVTRVTDSGEDEINRWS